MPREATQWDGLEAAMMTKRWLESTTYMDLPWNSYKHEPMCLVPCLGGGLKGFDLAGFFLDDKTPVVVENKGVNQSGGQYAEYQRFLAIAYSSTVFQNDMGIDNKRTFIWVTSHPFGYSREWVTFETADAVRAALEENSDLLHGRDIDDDLLREVAGRVWLLVWNKKQERLLLTSDEITRIHALLKRKED